MAAGSKTARFLQYIQQNSVSTNMKYFALFCSLCICLNVKALSLAETEDSIAYYHSLILKVQTDKERMALSDNMRNLFIAVLDDEQVFDYPFDKLRISKIKSSDGRVRIFNWNVPLTSGTHWYVAFLLTKTDRKGRMEWTELKCMKNPPSNLEFQVFNQKKWPGALYYEIIPMEKKNCKKYALLGWEGKDNLSTRKVVEIMTIGGKNNIRFGDDVFKDGTNAFKKRYVLEYSKEVSVVLKYYPEHGCIVMDELAPKNPVMEGIYSEYGPLGQYNLLRLHKGEWILEKNIDASKFAPNDGRPWNDPAQPRARN